MSKNIEVEIRGPLTNEQAKKLIESIHPTFTFKGTFDRYMIDFTTSEMKAQKLDVRARITNGKVEMIVKKGNFLSEARAEFPVQCKEDQFVPLVHALVACGYTQGFGCHRISERFENNEMELAIIHVPGHSIFYEAEMMVTDGNEVAAQAKLESWAAGLDLRVYQGNEFHNYVDTLDKEANDNLDFSNEAAWALLNERLQNRA